ncbi:hypothetical protein CRG98_010003 [Punica granatum]|uniref:Uncharacterized protein n=1 Tax=Punica granatum TaxID=22663 RepID=A0A2I0KMM3_PUNGR|nr:hypothetical protein CRG98_010003 [Punica granatum]
MTLTLPRDEEVTAREPFNQEQPPFSSTISFSGLLSLIRFVLHFQVPSQVCLSYADSTSLLNPGNSRSAQVELRYKPPINVFSNLLGVQHNQPRAKKPPRWIGAAPTSQAASRESNAIGPVRKSHLDLPEQPREAKLLVGSVFWSFCCFLQLTLSLFANFRSAQVELRYEPPITMFSNLLGVQRNRPRVKKPPRLTRIAPTSWTASRVDCIELGLQLQGAKPTSKNQFSNFPRLILES